MKGGRPFSCSPKLFLWYPLICWIDSSFKATSISVPSFEHYFDLSLFFVRYCNNVRIAEWNLDSFRGVGPHPLLVQHGKEAVPTKEAWHNKDHVRCLNYVSIHTVG